MRHALVSPSASNERPLSKGTLMAYDFEHTSEELFGLLELVERAFEVEVDDAYLELSLIHI